MCRCKPVKYSLNTRRKKVYFFLSIERYVNDRQRLTHFQSPPLRKGRPHSKRPEQNSLGFQSTPHKGATSGDYLVNSRTAAVNPTAKACFCQSSHSCNRASRASPLTAVVRESNCLCRASGSNKSGSCLHSPSYRASNSGFHRPPLTFSASSAIIDFAAFRRCVGL